MEVTDLNFNKTHWTPDDKKLLDHKIRQIKVEEQLIKERKVRRFVLATLHATLPTRGLGAKLTKAFQKLQTTAAEVGPAAMHVQVKCRN